MQPTLSEGLWLLAVNARIVLKQTGMFDFIEIEKQ
jgi:hypothetical protein